MKACGFGWPARIEHDHFADDVIAGEVWDRVKGFAGEEAAIRRAPDAQGQPPVLTNRQQSGIRRFAEFASVHGKGQIAATPRDERITLAQLNAELGDGVQVGHGSVAVPVDIFTLVAVADAWSLGLEGVPPRHVVSGEVERDRCGEGRRWDADAE